MAAATLAYWKRYPKLSLVTCSIAIYPAFRSTPGRSA
jgi:non-homologous end joining protein Ku